MSEQARIEEWRLEGEERREREGEERGEDHKLPLPPPTGGPRKEGRGNREGARPRGERGGEQGPGEGIGAKEGCGQKREPWGRKGCSEQRGPTPSHARF